MHMTAGQISTVKLNFFMWIIVNNILNINYLIYTKLGVKISFYMLFIYTKFQGFPCFITNFERCAKRIM